MVCNFESEPMHHDCLLVRRRKGLINPFGDIQQLIYQKQRKTKIKLTIEMYNSSLFFKVFG